MSWDTYKTKVVLKLQSKSLTYFSLQDSETVIQQMNGGRPVILQTIDRHYVIVNPCQIPAMEVYTI